MKVIMKIMVAILALTTLILTTRNSPAGGASHDEQGARKVRVSRFLQEKNPRAADHCKKDSETCSHTLEGGRNATCCNNKCMDLWYDDKNCGACKNKCAISEKCCRGKCVNLVYDKRHCGSCNTKCMPGGFCIYGICDYA